jgi:uncharacterized membrane protein (DUF2068 family)
MVEEVINPVAGLIRQKSRHNRWLILIAAFKLAQALLFIAIGLGALRLLHKDVEELLSQWANHLRFNPEWHFVKFALDRSTFINDKIIRRFSIGLFAYAALGLTEGIGLYLEKTWAEYMTLIITASFLPFEIFEIMRRVTAIRFGLLAINILVFFYLIKVVTERVRRQRFSKDF